MKLRKLSQKEKNQKLIEELDKNYPWPWLTDHFLRLDFEGSYPFLAITTCYQKDNESFLIYVTAEKTYSLMHKGIEIVKTKRIRSQVAYNHLCNVAKTIIQ